MEARSAHEELEDRIVAGDLSAALEAWMESVLPARIGAAVGGFRLFFLPRLWRGEAPRLDVSVDTVFGGVRRLSGQAGEIAVELRRIADLADSIPGRPHEETGKVGLRPVWTMEMRVSESGSERKVDLPSAHADLSDARKSLAAKAAIVGLIHDGFDVEPQVRIEPPVLARQGLRFDVADLMRGIVPASLR